MKPFIETFNGLKFEPLKPNFADIRIQDIAHALANQCRFSGHTRFHYSVAEHSVRVSEALSRQSKEVQLWGLLHDASEAYLVDLPTPLKLDPTIGTGYQAAEARLMLSVCKAFGLPSAEPLAVRWADADLLATEVRDLMHPDRAYWKKLTGKALPGRIRPWAPDVAEFEFMRRYRQVGGV